MSLPGALSALWRAWKAAAEGAIGALAWLCLAAVYFLVAWPLRLCGLARLDAPGPGGRWRPIEKNADPLAAASRQY